MTRRLDPADPAAIAAARELLAEAERADGTPPVSDQAVLAATQGKRELLGFGDEGRLDAVGILGEGELDLAVRPDARGRGLGTAALRAMLDAARSTGSDGSAGTGTGELRAWAHGENPAAEALLRGSGFAPIRTLLRMTLDPRRLPAAIAEARAMPPGFGVRAFDPANPSDAADWVRVNAAAFADHPEQGAITLDDFTAMTREPWFDPADLILAFDEDVEGAAGGGRDPLAGSTWVKTVRTGDGAEAGTTTGTETELYALAVDPAYAGRGLGAALLGETLRRMRAHEPGRVSLYVDGGNANALALYRRAGFETEQRSTQWLRLMQA